MSTTFIMNNIWLYLVFVAAAAATVFAFTAGATWAGICSTAAAVLAIGALVWGPERDR